MTALFFPKLLRGAAYPPSTTVSKYNEYRPYIRMDSKFRCVYCDVHEMELVYDSETRETRMELDHIRPKSKYPRLEKDPHNLVLACHACNQAKKDDWPAYGTQATVAADGVAGYIDPFIEDRNDYFKVKPDGRIEGVRDPAPYMIRFLALNRPSARRIRGRRILLEETKSTIEVLLNKACTELLAEIQVGSAQGSDATAARERLRQLDRVRSLASLLFRFIELD